MRLFKIATLILLSAAAGCSLPPPTLATAPITSQRPMRIVSLDYCADQFVLKLADRKDILALSNDATRDFSYLREAAKGMRMVRSTAEDVIALNPDLVVRSYGGGPNAKAFFERAGVKVHQIGYGSDFDTVRQHTREAAIALGQSARGEAVIADFDQRLASIKPAVGVSALYITPGGITTGPGTMIDLMMTSAGLTNFQTQKGWNQLPLEGLARQRPDMTATAFFGDKTNHKDYWSAARHPVAINIMRDLPVAALDGSTTSCGGWFVMDAVEQLAAKGRAVQAAKQKQAGASQ